MSPTHQEIINRWYHLKGWKPFPFQLEVCEAFLKGKHGILNAPTGSGKTYAMWLPIITQMLAENSKETKGLQCIWITPLRALAKDIRNALQEGCELMGMDWKVDLRTGDTPTAVRQQQVKQMPQILITTPESLHLLMALKENKHLFRSLKCFVVDEWHELLGSKRGTQVELALSYIKPICTDLRIWGISATIGNLEQARDVLLSSYVNPEDRIIVKSKIKKKTEIKSVLPKSMSNFPWGGFIGTKLLKEALAVIEKSTTTLLFTNTRSQCEIWYQALLDHSPDLAGLIAMHHGSISRELREWVEEALHEGRLKVVVCTASLDLGVDFRPVETVIQVGSPKGVARFLQRAGRSGHQPNQTSYIHFLPTHALELLEPAALRDAVDSKHVESRLPIQKPFDVLVQFLITLSVGEGLHLDEAKQIAKNTYAYREMSDEEWMEVINFIVHGGSALNTYDDYKKLTKDGEVYRIAGRRMAQRHRMGIGTIVGDPVMKVKYLSGRYIGTVEEYFIARLKIGDTFVFAGAKLDLVRVKEMTAFVRKSKKAKGSIPAWGGGRMPLSSLLSEILIDKIDQVARQKIKDPETKALLPIFDIQWEQSTIPKKDELLIEYVETDLGYHLFVYPFEGRLVHEILAALVAHRIAEIEPSTFSLGMNDYGFELLSDKPIPIEHALNTNLFDTSELTYDINQSVNSAELARRKFRDIAIIAGLIFQGFPGDHRSGKHLQSSTQLLFEVFSEHEPDNLLLRQAYQEVFADHLEEDRLRKAMQRMSEQKIILKHPEKPTPFGFPILTDGIRERYSNEDIEDKIKRMQLEYDRRFE